ncbi:type VII secretion target [Amycolatopsis sp. EV170708-02-1]|uniref:type VII secretion target n=1 Tax=Amycolatopsis sp. EV170708-02-1 TaxID=2919322 RepID=UPI001F0CB54A|nr:type VII secretion target [Amycolatopsis sp. EV170708-02-1]UMP07459.1 type VII secretion target [Amycolatopsis sp. EV170708-02-1]
MVTGFGVKTEAMTEFAGHLDQLEDALRKSADMVGSCVADPGIFGIFGGQIYGAGASMHCGKARDQLNKYSENVQEFSDRVREAAKQYNANEQETEKLITDAGKGIDEVKVK